MKGVMHIIESAVAVFLIFSFITLVFPKPSIELDETKYSTTNSALKSILISGVADKTLKDNNLSEVNEYLSKMIPWEFVSFIERTNISTHIIDGSEKNITFYANLTQINRVTVDIISPVQQEINISVNSVLAYSSQAREVYGIDITDNVIDGNNEINVKKSGAQVVYLVLKLSYENNTISQTLVQRISVILPYYLGEVKYVYVLV